MYLRPGSIIQRERYTFYLCFQEGKQVKYRKKKSQLRRPKSVVTIEANSTIFCRIESIFFCANWDHAFADINRLGFVLSTRLYICGSHL